VLAGAPAAGQTVFYVDDDTCPEIGSGTEANPFCSIQDDINAATDGDEIIVASGTYSETINLLGKAVWLHSSDGPEVTTISVYESPVSLVTCDSGEGPDTVLDGFTISGGGFHGTMGGVLAGAGMRIENSSPTVRRCVFGGNVAGAVPSCPPPFGPPAGVGGAVYTSNSVSIIVDCLFAWNRAMWVCGWCDDSICCQIMLGCCGTGDFWACGGGMGGAMYNDGNPTLINCTFVGNSADGDTIAGPMGGAVVGGGTLINCVLWDNGPYPLLASGPVYTSNVQGGWSGDGIGNIDADPIFVGPDHGDFRLSPGSPCIDAGDNTAVPEGIDTDLDGNPRFVDDPNTEDMGNGDPPIVDMGAYELQLPCPWNLNGDGVVDHLDLLELVQNMGPCDDPGNCPFDLNGDGVVNGRDVAELARHFGPCPF
jgi:hypothetical protein